MEMCFSPVVENESLLRQDLCDGSLVEVRIKYTHFGDAINWKLISLRHTSDGFWIRPINDAEALGLICGHIGMHPGHKVFGVILDGYTASIGPFFVNRYVKTV